MPQIIVCEWRVIFSENLLHKTVYPVKDPCNSAPLPTEHIYTRTIVADSPCYVQINIQIFCEISYLM